MQSDQVKKADKAQQKNAPKFSQIQVIKPVAAAKAKDDYENFSTSGCRPAGV